MREPQNIREIQALQLRASVHAGIALEQMNATCQALATLMVDERLSVKRRYNAAYKIRGLLEQLVLEMGRV